MQKKWKILTISLLFMIGFGFIIPSIFNIVMDRTYEITHEQHVENIATPLQQNTSANLITFYNLSYNPIGGIYVQANDSAFNEWQTPVLHDIRYIFSLLINENSTDISRANDMLEYIFKEEPLSDNSIFGQSFFTGFQGFGGFYKYFPYYWTIENPLNIANPNFICELVPYLSLILIQNQNDLTLSLYEDINAKLNLIADNLIRTRSDSDNLNYELLRIASIFMINSLCQKWNLEYQAITSFDQLRYDFYHTALISIESSQELEQILQALYLIYTYCDLEYKEDVVEFATQVLCAYNRPILDNTQINSTSWEESARIDTILLTGMNSSQIANFFLEKQSNFSFSYQDTITNIMIWLLPLIIYLGLIFSFIVWLIVKIYKQKYLYLKAFNPEIETENEDEIQALIILPLNRVIEGIILGVLPLTIILMLAYGHRAASFYFFLFFWPLILMYGYRKEEQLTFWLSISIILYYGILIFTLINWSIIPLYILFIFLYCSEIVHNIILGRKFLVGKEVGEGYNSKKMGVACFITSGFQVVFIVSQLINTYNLIIPIFFYLGFFIKGLIILRAKYG